MPSKQLIEWLNNNGEYVKTPSSTVEAPVVAKVFAAFPPVAEAEKPAPKKKAAAAAPEPEVAPAPPTVMPEAPKEPEPAFEAPAAPAALAEPPATAGSPSTLPPS